MIEAESDLYCLGDKFILIENQKAYDYELIENTILCLDENEIMGLEVLPIYQIWLCVEIFKRK